MITSNNTVTECCEERIKKERYYVFCIILALPAFYVIFWLIKLLNKSYAKLKESAKLWRNSIMLKVLNEIVNLITFPCLARSHCIQVPIGTHFLKTVPNGTCYMGGRNFCFIMSS